jgi:hypothetical protein
VSHLPPSEAGTTPSVSSAGMPGATVEEPAAAPPGDGQDPPSVGAGRAGRVPVWVLGLTAVVLCAPMLVAVLQLREPTWRPVLDLAMTELRVRDVGTSHTPLIGLPGRIGETLEEQGSHPGPLSFYALAPTYRLLGSSAWALLAATVVIHLGALLAALALARRRGGPPLVAAVALAIAVLTLGYGAGALVEPWNPYMPLLWWLVLLLAVWSVACDDLVGLPVAVGAGSFCAQTHIPYLSLTLGLGALGAGWVVWRTVQGGDGAPHRTEALRWGAAALALGVLLWLPPTVDQAVNEPGNYAKLVDHFTTPPEPETPIGLRSAATETLDRLDLWHLGSHQLGEPGRLTEGSAERFPSAWRGLALLVVWAGSAIVAVTRVRRRDLTALHVVAGTALVLGAFSISRIFGLTWYYLMLWMWTVAVLMAIATVWTVVSRWETTRGRPRRFDPRAPAGVLAVLALLVTLRTSVDATTAEVSDTELSLVLDDLVDPTIDAIEAGEGAATGEAGTYLVAWSDALHIGSQAYGLMSELERAGFDAGLLPVFQVPATEHRVVDPGDATARVELVTGRYIEEWRRRDGAVEVAHVDPRTVDDIDRLDELRSQVEAALRAEGLDDLVDDLDSNLFGVGVNPSVPDVTRRLIDEMLHIGMPTSVFVAPPGTP